MTAERLKTLIAMTGEERRVIARLLGFASENSLRQCEAGKATLPQDKAVWLESYAKFRSRQVSALSAWLQKNPPPTPNNG